MSALDAPAKVLRAADQPAAVRLRRWRRLKDRIASVLMTVGGLSVLAAILLIFFYLLYIVAPMFLPASMNPAAPLRGSADLTASTAFVTMEEYAEIGLRVTNDARATFFRMADGRPLQSVQLSATPAAAIAHGDLAQRSFGIALRDGNLLLLQHEYTVSYPGNVRTIAPSLSWPFGETPLVLDEAGRAMGHLGVQFDGEVATVAGLSRDDGEILLARFSRETSLLGDEVTVERSGGSFRIQDEITSLVLSKDQRSLYLATAGGDIYYYDITAINAPRQLDRVAAVSGGERITAMAHLAGGISLLVGDSTGRVTQWFPLRSDDNDYSLARVRSFGPMAGAITSIIPEFFRKAFAAGAADGSLAFYHTTAHRTVLEHKPGDYPVIGGSFGPRADTLLLDTTAGSQPWEVHNEHPEISFRSLWGKVWYESRQEPEYIWQSSSASSDFEPKFSLTPLAFGTMKAAFYAMLFAVPLGIAGAVYTAYFMSARMRNIVKPTIEIMAALPTVILGFLAGLWLAPLVEAYLPAVFLLVLFLPGSVLLSAAVWPQLPGALRHRVPAGWEGAVLMPVIILATWLAFALSPGIEHWLFGGNMPQWLTNELGIGYDQRNSLVVGVAIGFAVIPTIFSISEDAVFSVPRQLTFGSLALGATPWQTLSRVVILTASPGIFSAVMIGLGRAVGETMIVLMATGNTPIIDMNIFEGFRALSANIAVEMPESEVGSTHYRVLFLAALVLFMATFAFNTIAELVRQRLREKYSSL